MIRLAAASLALALAIVAPAAAEPFAGPRIEAIGGYDQTDTGPGLGAADGFVYGIGAGYDLRRGGLSVGLEAEANDATSRATVAGVRRGVGRSLYAGARLGVVVVPSLLAYAKGGYANGRFDSSAGDRYTGDGFRIGGGAELAVTDRQFVKAEYRYSDYGRRARGQSWVIAIGTRF